MESCNGVMCMKAGLGYLPFMCGILLLCFSRVVPNILTSDVCWIVHLYDLKNADCFNKKLVTVPQNLEHDIQVFKLQQNHITVLANKEFNRYSSLQEIYLTGNMIDTLFEHAFQGLENLQILDLENNELKDIPSPTFNDILSVRLLNLKSNQIHSVLENSFKMLKKLQLINLENCYISYVHPKAFLGLEKLVEINIANNDLQKLDATMEFSLPKSLRTFRIHDNKWICDCKMRWLRIWISNSSLSWDFVLDTPSCSGPPIIQSINWRSLSSEQFACAPQIVQNNKTSMDVSFKGNLTVECLVTGDPLPNIAWAHNLAIYKQEKNIKTTTYFRKGQKYTKTVLTLTNVQDSDIGVYKCVATNQGGTAEVSYSIKFINKPRPEKKKEVLFLGLSKNVAIGICVVFAALLLIFLIIVCCFLCYMITKKKKQNRAYKVREYQRPSNNVSKPEILQVNDKSPAKPKAKPNRYAGSNMEKELLAEKQELLQEKPPTQDTVNISALPVTRETNRAITDNRFKMKIFTNYGDAANSTTEEQETNLPPPPPTEAEAADPPGSMSHMTEGGGRNRPDRDTPDLLKDRIITNRAIPVPPPSVPNHIQSTHPRARENPYVTASELKASTLRKKTASADDLLDGYEDELYLTGDRAKRSSSRDDILLSPKTNAHSHPKKTRFQEPILKHRDHSSTCKNPVCMKDQVSDQPQKQKPEPLFKQGKSGGGGGGYYSKGTQREIDVDDLSSPDSRYDELGYKTIPARVSKSHRSPEPHHYSPPTSSQVSPSKSISQDSKTLPKRFHLPSKTVSFSEEGHPIIDLTQEMPEPIVISSLDTPARGGPVKLNTPGLYNTLPHLTKTQQGMKQGQISESPTGGRPATKTGQSTTLDDLLSPPFGQSPSGTRKLSSQTLPRKKGPRPGEKDEFGTAV